MKPLTFLKLGAATILAVAATGCERSLVTTAEQTPTNQVASIHIGIAPAPKGMPLNDGYRVSVREPGGQWQALSVYNVKVGHQEGNDPLRLSVAPRPYKGPTNASLVLFDFDQTVEIQIKYTRHDITNFVLSPGSYGLHPRTVGKDTIEFTLAQNREAPRKLVFRPNGDWESECLHLLTNPLETNAPAPAAENVLAIKPGDEIPRVLPEGKNTYYFLPGIHNLPGGAWVDLDLGEVRSIASFDLMTGPKTQWLLPGGIRFRIETRLTAKAAWSEAHEHLADPKAFDLKHVALKSTLARYVRLTLLGNFNPARTRDYNAPHAAFINQFTLYDADGNKLSVGKAIAGALPNYGCVTDGMGKSKYGSVYGAETFFIPRSDTRIYLAPGAVLRGAFGGQGLSHVRIDGRGILDAGELIHSAPLAEGKTSPIRINKSSALTVEGITILDAPMWTVVLNECQGVRVRQVNILNSMVNGDGINFSGNRDAEASGCFIRICDDLLVVYHGGETRDIAFRHCVLWSDGGRIALFGMGGQGDIRNLSVEDCDVLAHQSVWDAKIHGNAIQVWPTYGRTIEDVTFKDIRFEAARYPAISGLFQLKTVPFGNRAPGILNHVCFENIDYPFPGMLNSYILAPDANHPVTDVMLKRVRWGQRLLTAQVTNVNITMRNVAAPRIE